MDNLVKVLARAWGEAEQQADLIGIACKLVEKQISREAAALEIIDIVSDMASDIDSSAIEVFEQIRSGQDKALTA